MVRHRRAPRSGSGPPVADWIHAYLAHPSYVAGMERLVAIQGELLRAPSTDATTTSRRRLVIERLSDGTERIPVRVIALYAEGCTIASPRRLADVDGKLWLKVPGFEGFQLAAIDEEDGHLLCRFAQPLSTVVLRALTNPPAHQIRHPVYQPRCTLL